MTTTAINHRKFLLNLSLPNGQKLASSQGYISPESAVQEMESMDVLTRWVTMKGSGVMDPLQECAAWMTHLVAGEEWTPEAINTTFTTFTSFAASLLYRLKEEGYIVFAHEPTIQYVKEGEEGKLIPVDPIRDYTYKDVIGHLDFEPIIGELDE